MTTEDKKAWTSASIKPCEKASLTENKFQDVYAGSSYFTTEEMLNKVKKHMKSYQGKLYINPDIRDKLARKQNLEPEEHNIYYCPIAVCHQQKKVMDHIFGDRKFQLKELHEICKWMKDPKTEESFFNSQLVASAKGKEARLSHSTIASLAHSILELLKYVQHEYMDNHIKEATTKAISSVQNIEQKAATNAHHLTQRRGYLERENYIVELSNLQKFIESEAHTEIINAALKLAECQTDEEHHQLANEEWGRRQIFKLQAHLAVLLTLHTGKRPGVICGIKIQDIANAKEFKADKSRGQVLLI